MLRDVCVNCSRMFCGTFAEICRRWSSRFENSTQKYRGVLPKVAVCFESRKEEREMFSRVLAHDISHRSTCGICCGTRVFTGRRAIQTHQCAAQSTLPNKVHSVNNYLRRMLRI